MRRERAGLPSNQGVAGVSCLSAHIETPNPSAVRRLNQVGSGSATFLPVVLREGPFEPSRGAGDQG